jgi:hypothetical protein
MNLQQMITLFRTEAFDNSNPPLFPDSEIIVWLNEAQTEAAIRAKLLRENSNPLLVQFDIRSHVMDYQIDTRMFEIVYASLVYKGSDGMLPYVLAITLAEELDGVRPFWRTLPFRPTGIIHNDTMLRTDALPDTEYTIHVEGYRLPMWYMDEVLTPEVLATGSFTLTGGASGQINSIAVNGINILGGSGIPFNTSLSQTATDVATQINANQNKFTASVLGETVTLTDIPGSGVLHNGYAITVDATTITSTTTAFSGGVDAIVGSPEINGVHHRHLVKWALHRGYQKPDAEVFDPSKSQLALDEFEAYFGKRPDAWNRKRINASRPHRNLAYG